MTWNIGVEKNSPNDWWYAYNTEGARRIIESAR